MTTFDATQDFLIGSVVALAATLIVLLFISIYRSQRRCNKRIDTQTGEIEKIGGRIDLINLEISDMKLKQAVSEATANATAAATAAAEHKAMASMPPFPYMAPSPVQLIQTQPAPAPVQFIQPQPIVQPVVQPIVQPAVQPVQYAQPQQEPQPVPSYTRPAAHPQQAPRPAEKQPSTIDLIYSQLADSQDHGRTPEYGGSPDYNRPRSVAMTEYRLPDYEDFSYPTQRKAPEQVQEYRNQSEPQLPGKYRSLNDNISRTGRIYSEEELYNKILD